MNSTVSENILIYFRDYLAEHLGLYFPDNRLGEMKRGLLAATAEFGMTDIAQCIQWLLNDQPTRRQVEILAGFLTVGESYFWRDPSRFKALQEHILAKLILRRSSGSRHLRIWSAGCCSGEEPYSLAILLHTMLGALRQEWQITILATDINPHFIQQAEKGLYSSWSFRTMPGHLKERYFIVTSPGNYQILPEFKEMVTFSYHNLATDPYPAMFNNTNAMDIILCCNILMYFSPEFAAQVAQQLSDCLVEGGWLIVAPSENHLVSLALDSRPTRFDGLICHCKKKRKADSRPPEIFSQVTQEKESAQEPRQRVSPPRPAVARQAPDLSQVLSLYQEGNYHKAVDVLENLLLEAELGAKQRHEILCLLSRACANQGQLDEALKWCDQIIAEERLNPAGHYLMAVILQERGNLDQARVALQKTLYLAPDYVLAHFALANISRQQGKMARSANHLNNALSLLQNQPPEESLPDAEGITNDRLLHIIRAMANGGNAAKEVGDAGAAGRAAGSF